MRWDMKNFKWRYAGTSQLVNQGDQILIPQREQDKFNIGGIGEVIELFNFLPIVGVRASNGLRLNLGIKNIQLAV